MGRFSEFFQQLTTEDAFKVEEGRIKIKNLDWVLYPSSGLAATLQYVGEDLGEAFLFELGKDVGDRTIGDLEAQLDEDEIEEDIQDTLALIGLGSPMLEQVDSDSEGPVLAVEHSSITEKAQEQYGDDSRVCSFLAGFFSKYVETVSDHDNVELEESACRIETGNDLCLFEFSSTPQ